MTKAGGPPHYRLAVGPGWSPGASAAYPLINLVGKVSGLSEAPPPGPAQASLYLIKEASQ